MIKPFIAALLGLIISGCASTASVKFYVLEPLSQTSTPTITSLKQSSIGVGPITVPTLLEHQQIVTRSSDNTVQIAEFHQWASPLQDILLQTLTRNLASLQPNYVFRAYPWSIHGTVDLQVVVDIIRFDTSPGESANLEANWTIKNESSHKVLNSGRSVIKHPLSDSSYPGTVRALSQLLRQFSQELSSALLKLDISKGGLGAQAD
jgi:uncharacterized protein